jgi:parallel beta-helix repeat protein
MQQGNPSIAWVTPATVGRDTITITGTDGKGGTTTLVETIRVGTLKSDPIQAANITWNVSDSPFIIRPAEKKFVIDRTGSLTIQAGSDLLVDKTDLEIDVVGTLRTNGTESGNWTGLIVTPDGSAPLVRLYHTDILYAKDAIFAVGDSEVRLNGCRIKLSAESGVLFQSSQDLHVVNSAITDNVKSGIRIGGPAVSTLPDSVVISGNSLALNGDISGATAYTNQAAIYIDIPDYSRDSAIHILDNEISNNGFPAIHLVRACYPEIHNNSVFDNERGKVGQRYNIRLQNGFGVGGPQDTLGARQNYWGAPYTTPATDSLVIKQTIWDSEDAAGIAVRVIVYPWLHAAP